MKNRIFVSLFILLMALPLTPVFAAAGTEGREFWVALTIGRGPKDTGKNMEHYICVSSKSRSGQVTVTNPVTGWTKTYTIPTGTGWLEIRDIPQQQMYPFASNTTGQQSASGQTYPVGIKVEATVDVSVFAALRYENAFDASNILPITALQGDYIIQDYPAYANETPSTSFTNFCVLATENGTQVEITPHSTTYDNKPAGVPFTVNLNAGQVYYVVSQESTEVDKSSQDSYQKSLSGSTVKVLNGKKIAVFNGDICTRTPNFQAARDMHYEQAIPTDYWGREFIVTRSMEKDANRIRITAQEDGTTINLDGVYYKTLNALETCEIELAVAADMKDFNKTNKEFYLTAADQFVKDAIYIQTSCPVAVYNYDTGNSYKSSATSEIYNSYGDPSMTWVSPIEQNITDITFGVMNTNITTRHFVNIVTLTSNTSSMTLREVRGGQFSNSILTPASWTAVVGNPQYSYARVPLTINSASIYNLQGNTGFIAHVYGNGDDESYAYSCGSAAVKRGIQLNGEILLDQAISDRNYCLGEEIVFNTQVGGDIIDSVIWDLGDGVRMRGSNPVMHHIYEAPGWYNLSVTVFAHKECPETVYPAEQVNVRFYVNQPDTITHRAFICEGESYEFMGETYTQSTDIDIPDACDHVYRFHLEVGQPSAYEFDTIVQDSLLWHGVKYYDSGDYEWIGKNAVGCDSTVTMHLRVITCLNMSIPAQLDDICGDDQTASIPYTRYKGDMGDATLIIMDNAGGVAQQILLTTDVDNQLFIFDCSSLRVGHYKAQVSVEDTICGEPFVMPTEFSVLFASSIFEQKWDDVFAILNAQYNGGYEFTAYQWYRNEQPIEGATNSIYMSEIPISADDEYKVLLTLKDGTSIFSCPKNGKVQGNASKAKIVNVTPTVVEVNGLVRILAEQNGMAVLYDVYGSKCLQINTLAGQTSLNVPDRVGVYLLQVVLEDGTTTTVQLLVK